MAIAAVAPSEELQPGKIYFVLPVEMQRCRVTHGEVAALTIKASSALVNVTTWRGGVRPAILPVRGRQGLNDLITIDGCPNDSAP